MGEEPSPRSSPFWTFIATNAPGVLNELIAASPACCTGVSMRQQQVVAGLGCVWLSTPPVGWPAASTWTRVMPLVPRRTLS